MHITNLPLTGASNAVRGGYWEAEHFPEKGAQLNETHGKLVYSTSNTFQTLNAGLETSCIGGLQMIRRSQP